MAVGSTRRWLILGRDGWICQLCHKEIPEMDKWPRGYVWAPSVDHIIPVSKGGPDAIWNLRASHQKCNGDRGNGVDRNALEAIERNLLSRYPGTMYAPESARNELRRARRLVAESLNFKNTERNVPKSLKEARPCLKPGCQNKEWMLNGKPWAWQLCEPHARERFRGT